LSRDNYPLEFSPLKCYGVCSFSVWVNNFTGKSITPAEKTHPYIITECLNMLSYLIANKIPGSKKALEDDLSELRNIINTWHKKTFFYPVLAHPVVELEYRAGQKIEAACFNEEWDEVSETNEDTDEPEHSGYLLNYTSVQEYKNRFVQLFCLYSRAKEIIANMQEAFKQNLLPPDLVVIKAGVNHEITCAMIFNHIENYPFQYGPTQSEIFEHAYKIIDNEWPTQIDLVTVDCQKVWKKNVEYLAQFKVHELAESSHMWYTNLSMRSDEDFAKYDIHIEPNSLMFSLTPRAHEDKGYILTLYKGEIININFQYSFNSPSPILQRLMIEVEKSKLDLVVKSQLATDVEQSAHKL